MVNVRPVEFDEQPANNITVISCWSSAVDWLVWSDLLEMVGWLAETCQT
jgi:hypothetical protein